MIFPSLALDFDFRTPPPVDSSTYKKEHAESRTGRHKILIVEDETLVAENIREILEAQNFQVVGIAVSGKEALQKVETEHPNLVLMDIRIRGDIDGIQTALILQQKSADNPVPVVFVTAHSRNQFPHLNLLKPNYLYLTKPYSDLELVRAVKNGLQIKS